MKMQGEEWRNSNIWAPSEGSEEESTRDLRWRVSARVKGKVYRVDSETSNVVRVGDGGTDEKTGGGWRWQS